MERPSDDNRRLAWYEWQAGNRIQDVRGDELRARWTNYGTMAALALTAALWAYAPDYHMLARFVVAAAVSTAISAIAAQKPLWSEARGVNNRTVRPKEPE